MLLDAGIEVVSTCNVQHLESVADAVADDHRRAGQRAAARTRCSQSADEIELVDMSPHALRQRMKHGNVYPPERTRVALDRFFTEPNLTALRELALRFVTQRVDEQMEGIVATYGLGALPRVSERIVASVDDRPISRRTLRRAAAYASTLRAPLTAVVVETPEIERLSFDRERDLRENLEFAADLGAEVVRFPGSGHRSRDRTHGSVAPRDGCLHRLSVRAGMDRCSGRPPVTGSWIACRICRSTSSAADHPRTGSTPGYREPLIGQAGTRRAASTSFGRKRSQPSAWPSREPSGRPWWRSRTRVASPAAVSVTSTVEAPGWTASSGSSPAPGEDDARGRFHLHELPAGGALPVFEAKDAAGSRIQRGAAPHPAHQLVRVDEVREARSSGVPGS